ncbi:hypothetical protein [Aquimarina sp. 2201CG14-23]|uniref:hypothetical protein n=1 Tax=Aquimarina mycalae TaxID=3040073 RepID=UPI0024782806|nr:hypothetical protein [Aquimarina sp. 2201CG14-23]MDH7447795.1 hypothetical protein [Aquimarina sp. 2201CG14-23]
MNKIFNLFLLLVLITSCHSKIVSQNIIESYKPKRNDSIRTGTGEKDFLPLIQKGYTLILPKSNTIKGVLIFLEDSEYDKRNKSAKQMYNQASEKSFAVLSVSTEIPLDFYFSEASIHSTHRQIREAFAKHNLPNKNIFFLGASLVGHRAMKYIEFIKKGDFEFQLNLKGIVICNFTMDWTRKWYQHRRDIRIDRINLWEPKFINYMLETNLSGTPETASENYHNFSTYSYFDDKNENIEFYKDYSVRAYIEPAIKYRLKKYFRTLYENNATDIVGFLAELKLAGNENSELIVLQPQDNSIQNKSSQATWDKIDKDELMQWIQKITKK